MTSQRDQLQALIAEIDAMLGKASPKLPWVVSNETAQQRRVLEKTREYLQSLQQETSVSGGRVLDSATWPLTNLGEPALGATESPEASASTVLQALLQEMQHLRSQLVQPLRSEISTLQQEREHLLREVRQLEQERQALQPSPALAQASTVEELFQALASRLESQLMGQIDRSVQRINAEVIDAYRLTEAAVSAPEEDLELPRLTPVQRLEQLKQVQRQSDELLLNLDRSMRTVFESLQQSVYSYQASLSQGLDNMQTLGQQGEMMFKALINHLAQQMSQEAPPTYLEGNLRADYPAQLPLSRTEPDPRSIDAGEPDEEQWAAIASDTSWDLDALDLDSNFSEDDEITLFQIDDEITQLQLDRDPLDEDDDFDQGEATVIQTEADSAISSDQDDPLRILEQLDAAEPDPSSRVEVPAGGVETTQYQELDDLYESLFGEDTIVELASPQESASSVEETLANLESLAPSIESPAEPTSDPATVDAEADTSFADITPETRPSPADEASLDNLLFEAEALVTDEPVTDELIANNSVAPFETPTGPTLSLEGEGQSADTLETFFGGDFSQSLRDEAETEATEDLTADTIASLAELLPDEATVFENRLASFDEIGSSINDDYDTLGVDTFIPAPADEDLLATEDVAVALEYGLEVGEDTLELLDADLARLEDATSASQEWEAPRQPEALELSSESSDDQADSLAGGLDLFFEPEANAETPLAEDIGFDQPKSTPEDSLASGLDLFPDVEADLDQPLADLDFSSATGVDLEPISTEGIDSFPILEAAPASSPAVEPDLFSEPETDLEDSLTDGINLFQDSETRSEFPTIRLDLVTETEASSEEPLGEGVDLFFGPEVTSEVPPGEGVDLFLEPEPELEESSVVDGIDLFLEPEATPEVSLGEELDLFSDPEPEPEESSVGGVDLFLEPEARLEESPEEGIDLFSGPEAPPEVSLGEEFDLFLEPEPEPEESSVGGVDLFLEPEARLEESPGEGIDLFSEPEAPPESAPAIEPDLFLETETSPEEPSTSEDDLFPETVVREEETQEEDTLGTTSLFSSVESQPDASEGIDLFFSDEVEPSAAFEQRLEDQEITLETVDFLGEGFPEEGVTEDDLPELASRSPEIAESPDWLEDFTSELTSSSEAAPEQTLPTAQPGSPNPLLQAIVSELGFITPEPEDAAVGESGLTLGDLVEFINLENPDLEDSTETIGMLSAESGSTAADSEAPILDWLVNEPEDALAAGVPAPPEAADSASEITLNLENFIEDLSLEDDSSAPSLEESDPVTAESVFDNSLFEDEPNVAAFPAPEFPRSEADADDSGEPLSLDLLESLDLSLEVPDLSLGAPTSDNPVKDLTLSDLGDAIEAAPVVDHPVAEPEEASSNLLESDLSDLLEDVADILEARGDLTPNPSTLPLVPEVPDLETPSLPIISPTGELPTVSPTREPEVTEETLGAFLKSWPEKLPEASSPSELTSSAEDKNSPDYPTVDFTATDLFALESLEAVTQKLAAEDDILDPDLDASPPLSLLEDRPLPLLSEEIDFSDLEALLDESVPAAEREPDVRRVQKPQSLEDGIFLEDLDAALDIPDDVLAEIPSEPPLTETRPGRFDTLFEEPPLLDNLDLFDDAELNLSEINPALNADLFGQTVDEFNLQPSDESSAEVSDNPFALSDLVEEVPSTEDALTREADPLEETTAERLPSEDFFAPENASIEELTDLEELIDGFNIGQEAQTQDSVPEDAIASSRVDPASSPVDQATDLDSLTNRRSQPSLDPEPGTTLSVEAAEALLAESLLAESPVAAPIETPVQPANLTPARLTPTPEASPEAPSENWFLGIDLGTTGLSAVLLNQTAGQVYPLYWVDNTVSGVTADKFFRLPAIASVSVANTPRDNWRLQSVGSSALTVTWDDEAGFDDGENETAALLLKNLKPLLRLGIPHKEGTGQEEPQVQWSETAQVPLQAVQASVQALLATLLNSGQSPLSVGAVGLEAADLTRALRQLEGVIVSYPANWPDTYSFNLREAILAAGLAQSPSQIYFIEDAIAAVLSGLPDPANQSDAASTQPLRQQTLYACNWSGGTVVISAGATLTELGVVYLPSPLSTLSYENFALYSLAYAGDALDLDIIGHLLHPSERRQSRGDFPFGLPNPSGGGWGWQTALPELDQTAWANLELDRLEMPRIAEPDLPLRYRLQQRLETSLLGQSVLEAARHLKLILQHQNQFELKLADQRWIVRRKDLENRIVLPYIQRLNGHLNRLMSQVGLSAQGVNQVICTGGTASLPAITRWLRQKFPNATIIQDTYPNNRPPSCSRVAYGLVNLVRYPQILDLTRHQYSDNFLLMELLRTFPDQPMPLNGILHLLEQRGINTQACELHLIALLEGRLPPGLVPTSSDAPPLALSSLQSEQVQALNRAPLFTRQNGQIYVPNTEQCQRLLAYLMALLAGKNQQLEDPLLVELDRVEAS
ncbi:MAG TPA: hypothetical protein V6D07_11130 [Trichocoleus sp.]